MCIRDRGNTFSKHFSVAFVHFLLPSASRVVFPVSYLLFCRSEQIDLVQIFLMAYIHDGLL